jgi:hypothetical protein
VGKKGERSKVAEMKALSALHSEAALSTDGSLRHTSGPLAVYMVPHVPPVTRILGRQAPHCARSKMAFRGRSPAQPLSEYSLSSPAELGHTTPVLFT